MAVSFVAAANANNGASSTTSLQINVPAGTADGDLMFASINIAGAATITPPAGWSSFGSQPVTNTIRNHCFVRVPAASEPANYTWTFTSNRNWGSIITLRGTATAAVVDVQSSSTGASTSAVATSVTTTLTGDMLVLVVSEQSSGTPTTPGGMTQRGLADTGFEAGAVFTELLGAPGATGTRTSTVANTNWLTQMFAIKAAAAATSQPSVGFLSAT